MTTPRVIAASLLALTLGLSAAVAEDAHGTPHPPRETWSFAGIFGKFDQAQVQRGFQVYREVCSNCHSINLVRFRNLSQPGGPEFSAGQVKALAAEYKVKDGPNDAGEMFERPGRPADALPAPYPNEKAAAAVFGKAPPDFSVLAKARTYERGFPLFVVDAMPFVGYSEQGVDYIHALLNGYEDPPGGKEVPAGTNYNKYYPGNLIAMAKPLSDGQVSYAKGADGQPVVPETVDQYSRDVAAFMAWSAEPHMEARKALGFRVILFLIILSGLLYYVKKKVWADVGGEVHGLQPELHKAG